MDYKKIIKSRKARELILNSLYFIPDKTMIKLQYRIKTGRKLNLNKPIRYSEKMQLYKLYYREPLMRVVADKAAVKQYITEQGFGDVVIPTIGVYDAIEQIDIDKLPDVFVAKDTLGGGGSSVFVCRDKKKLDRNNFLNMLDSWLKRPKSYRGGGREWVYGGQHRVIIEQYIEHDDSQGLIDYKFLCFNGRAEYLYIISNRVLGENAELGIYDRDFRKVNAYRADEKAALHEIPKPDNYDVMLNVAETLAKPFPYARIDLYNIDGKIYFGEITLTDGSGYMKFEPDSFDMVLGDKFILTKGMDH